jgi:hypothetical protein
LLLHVIREVGRPRRAACQFIILEHHPEKWEPVFRKNHALMHGGFFELAKHLVAALDGGI